MLVDDLLRYTEQHGGELRVEHEAVHLLRNQAGEVIGVEAHVGRRTVIIGARRGVIFGSGGFLHDERLALEHLRGPVFGGAAAAEATGDFVRIGMEAGAPLGNMAHAWWSQVVVELAVRRRATTGDVYSPYGDSMLMVNRFGRRAVNEKAPYNERSQAHFDWDPYRGEYPNLLLFMIFDQAVVESPRPKGEAGMFRWPVPLDDRPRQYVIKVDSLEELADELRVRLARISSHTGGAELDDDFTATLAKTIDRFNEMAARGHDDDFSRGATPIEQTWAGPAHDGAPTGTMHPLSPTGPYYCVILGPGALDTKGGPITDEYARVLSMAASRSLGCTARATASPRPPGRPTGDRVAPSAWPSRSGTSRPATRWPSPTGPRPWPAEPGSSDSASASSARFPRQTTSDVAGRRNLARPSRRSPGPVVGRRPARPTNRWDTAASGAEHVPAMKGARVHVQLGGHAGGQQPLGIGGCSRRGTGRAGRPRCRSAAATPAAHRWPGPRLHGRARRRRPARRDRPPSPTRLAAPFHTLGSVMRRDDGVEHRSSNIGDTSSWKAGRVRTPRSQASRVSPAATPPPALMPPAASRGGASSSRSHWSASHPSSMAAGNGCSGARRYSTETTAQPTEAHSRCMARSSWSTLPMM